MGVCGKHWKWIQLRSCKIWCKIYKENTYVNIIILRGRLYHLFEVLEKDIVGRSALRAPTARPAGANVGRSANWLLASHKEIDAISNLAGDEGPEATDVSIPKVFYPAYEFKSYQCELPEPQRKPQLLLYKGGIVRVSVITVTMRMLGRQDQHG